MATAKRFEELIIWQKAMEIVVKNYSLFKSENLKDDKILKSQMMRSSFSISNNIAKGFDYNNNNKFKRFLGYSKGLAKEFRSQIIFLKKIAEISNKQYEDLHSKISILSRQIEKFKNLYSMYNTQLFKPSNLLNLTQ